MSRTSRHRLKLVILVLFIFASLGISSAANAGAAQQSKAKLGQAVQSNSVATTEETTMDLPNPYDTFPTSLHATREGKATWYSAENGGFEQLTGIPMSQLTCQKCHPTIPPSEYVPSCTDCHESLNPAGNPVADSTCLACHARQGLEIKLGYSDVHRDAGFQCRDCHTPREMHGDGTQYTSWLEPGAMDIRCETCHTQTATMNTAHVIHTSTVDCTACHTQSVVACYNCHFESEVAGNRKRFYAPMKDWVLLLQRQMPDGTYKVHAASFQSVVYQGKSFVAIAPYRAHTITKQARDCGDCHNNAAVQEYVQTGKIMVARWDGSKLVHPTGVVPIPPDWKDALQFDFVDYLGDPAAETDPSLWQFLKSGADLKQMLFAKPLSEEQMQQLEMPFHQ